MTDDAELIARLRDAPADGLGTENLCLEAADRIDALTKERDQHWDSFVHWHKQADDLTGQLAAARQDAKEAEVYAEEVEKERDDYAHKLMQANNTYTEMHLEIERLSDKLAKAVEALLWCSGSADFNEGGVARKGWLKVCAPLLKGESHE